MSRIKYLQSKPFEECLMEHFDNKAAQEIPNNQAFNPKWQAMSHMLIRNIPS